MEIKVKKLRENAKLPSAGSKYAAGYDLYACLETEEIIWQILALYLVVILLLYVLI